MKLSSIKIICNLSFIFIIGNFILEIMGISPINEYIFLWLFFINIFLYNKKYKDKYIEIVAFASMLIPMLFIKDNIQNVILIFISALMFYNYKDSKIKNNYGEMVEEFKKVFLIILVVVFISSTEFSKSIVSITIIPYALMYLVFSVVLLRYLRNYEHNSINKEMDKINIRYSIIIVLSSILLALKPIRQSMVRVILLIYNGLVSIIIYISSWLFLLIGTILEKLISLMLKNYKSNYLQEFQISVKRSPFENIHRENNNFITQNGILYKLVTIVGNIIFFLIIFYIIVKILKKKSSIDKNYEEYKETREFIATGKEKKNIADIIRQVFKKRNNNSKIRYYYKKYMEKCVELKIDINNSDTTKDIYVKSKGLFNNIQLKKMRNIYLYVRYGDKDSSKENVEEFCKLYKNLRL